MRNIRFMCTQSSALNIVTYDTKKQTPIALSKSPYSATKSLSNSTISGWAAS